MSVVPSRRWRLVLALLLFLAGVVAFMARVSKPDDAPASPKDAPVSVPEAPRDELESFRDEPAPATQSPVVRDPPARAMRPLPPTLPAAEWHPLPSEALPLSAVLPELKVRADRGDASAACRLAAELGFCRRTRLERPVPAPLPHERDARGNPPGPRFLRPEAHCAGVPEDELMAHHAYTRQAALAGNIAAIEEYVSGRSLFMDLHANAQWLETYRAEAPRLVESAVQAGSIAMLWELAMVHDDRPRIEGSLLARAIGETNDPERRRQLRHLLSLALSESQARRIAVSPEESASPQARQAQQRFADWFGGKRQGLNFGGFRQLEPWVSQPSVNETCTSRFINDPLAMPAIDWGTGDR